MAFIESMTVRNLEFRLAAKGWLAGGLLFLLATLVYANSFPGAFILDDIHIAQNNPLVKDVDVLTIFQTDYWHGMENSGLFRPLTILSLALNRALLGSEAWSFHLVNVVLHALVSILFYVTLLRWDVSRVVGLLAAALFSVHPIHTEVVDVIVGRSELLVAFFVLLAFIGASSDRRSRQLMAALAFFCALLSKENAITFLLLLPTVDAFFAGTLRIWRQRWRLYLFYSGVALVWLAWRTYGLTSDLPRSTMTEAAAPLAHVDVITRVLSALEHQWFYLKLHLWPRPLQSVYSVADLPPFITTPFSPTGAVVLVATAGLALLLGFGLHRRHPAALFGLLYIFSFSITANILFPIGVTMAERLTYLPSMWFCAALAALLLDDRRAPPLQRTGLVVAGLLVLFYGGLCLERNRDYASEPVLWMAEVQQNPRDFLAWQNVGEVLTNHRRYVEAEEAYRRMLELAPNYPGGLRSWTFFLLTQRRFAEALESSRRSYAVSEQKGEKVAICFDSLDMAESLLELGRYDEAMAALARAGTILGRVSRYNELLARSLNALGRDEQAVAAFAKVTTIAPGSNLHQKLATSLLRLGRLDEAREQLWADIGVRGATAETLNLLGVVEAQQENWPAAVEAFGRAMELDGENRYYRENYERASQALPAGE